MTIDEKEFDYAIERFQDAVQGLRFGMDTPQEDIDAANLEYLNAKSALFELAAAPSPAPVAVKGWKRVPVEFLDFVKNAPVSSGVCCCGDNMQTHTSPMSCGHSPVDQWDYSLSRWLNDIDIRSALVDPVADEAVGQQP